MEDKVDTKIAAGDYEMSDKNGCGTVDTLSPEDEKKLVRKIDLR